MRDSPPIFPLNEVVAIKFLSQASCCSRAPVVAAEAVIRAEGRILAGAVPDDGAIAKKVCKGESSVPVLCLYSSSMLPTGYCGRLISGVREGCQCLCPSLLQNIVARAAVLRRRNEWQTVAASRPPCHLRFSRR